jgi:hypothetical protein
MSGQYAGAPQQRSILPVVLIVIGVIVLLIGAVTFAAAEEAKPSLENAFADPTGDLLTQEAYDRTRNFGIAALVIGALCIGGGILWITQRRTAPQQPVYYGQQQQQPVHYGYQQPQAWAAPPPAPAPPAPPPGPWQAPPPDSSQRVG